MIRLIRLCRFCAMIVILAICIPGMYAYPKDPVLILRGEGQEFRDVLSGLTSEIINDFIIHDMVVTKKTAISDIESEVTSKKPKLAVLMDNLAISLFKKYHSGIRDTSQVLPSVSLMGVLVANAIDGLSNATGISYEVPAVTSILSLRTVLNRQINTVGVVHREFLENFIEVNKAFCKKERIDLIDISLPNKSRNMKYLLRKALAELIETRGIQALWVPNDNLLLQSDYIESVWVPITSQAQIPVIVGVDVFVNPQMNFGTFAVLPDHLSLGNQAAEIIYNIRENNWKVMKSKVEPPLAIYKIINYRQAKKSFGISDETLKSIDKVLK
ncbi:MAG: hypothetical protein GX089_09995 [Fibrobacter sp.]|nr:hypothetical protein [Fibrobacter sp.]